MTPAEFLTQTALGAADAVRWGAPINARAAAAHAANETGYGRSQLGRSPHYNLFGVKATGVTTPHWHGTSVTMPTWEVVNGQRVNIDAAFRSYESYAHAFMDYGDVINRVYPHAVLRSGDPNGFLAGLFLTGPRKWATDPQAFDKAARIMGMYSGTLDEALTMSDPDEATVVVLTDLSWADRLGVLLRSPAVLRGAFVHRYREREDGGRLDVRRA